MKNFHLIKLISIFILFGSFSTKAQTSTYYTVSGPTRGSGPLLNTEPIGSQTVWNVIHSPIAYGGASVNSWSSAQSIGFPFSFYGSPATHFCVSKNYLLTFDTTVAGTTVNSSITTDNTALPNANLPDHTIAYFWGGFGNPPPIGIDNTIQMKTFGTTPNRQLWIRNYSYEFEAQDWSFNFVVLEETTHKIYVVIGTCSYQGVGSYTVGVQLNSTTAVQHPNSPNISSINGSFSIPWSSVSYYEFTPRLLVNDDAGILSLDAPTSLLSPGSQSVQVSIKNYGINNLDSVKVNWSVDGITQTSHSWTGSLALGAVAAAVNIGSYNFTLGNPTLKIWTSNPNGNADNDTSNDTLEVSLVVCNLLSGAYTLGGTSSDFPNFDSLATFLNNCGVSGPVIIKVAPGTYREQFTLGNIAGVSPTNTIVIDGGDNSLARLTHDGSTSNATVAFDSTSYVSLRNITLENTKRSIDTWVVHLQKTDHVVIDSCLIEQPVNARPDRGGIVGLGGLSGDFAYTTFTTNKHLTVSDNIITGGFYGIFLDASKSNKNVGNRILRNRFSDIDDMGIYMGRADSLMISGNVIENPGYDAWGIYCEGITDFEIRANNLLVCGDEGIVIRGGSSSGTARSLIANNMIYAPSNSAIRMSGDNSNVNIYHNTAVGDPAMMFTGSNSDMSLYNNIFSGRGIALEALSGLPSTIDIDYNLYQYQARGNIAWDGSTYANLAAWQAAKPALNQNSVEGNPLFVSATSPADLHLIGTLANDTGDNSVGIHVDIDGDSRPLPPSTKVDIGADEYHLPTCLSSTGLSVSAKSLLTASLSWTTGGALNWNIEYGPQGFIPGSGTFVYNVLNPHILTGLNPNTNYDFYVQDSCGISDVSVWSGPFSFIMPCSSLSPATLPLIEDFESLSGTFQQDTVIFCGSTYAWSYETFLAGDGRLRFAVPGFANNGSSAATLDVSSSNKMAINYLILTADLSSYSSSSALELEFSYVHHDEENDSNDRVWIRGSNTNSWMQIYDLYTNQDTAGTYKQVTNLDIDSILANAAPPQRVSSIFQVRFGQRDNNPATSRTLVDGYSFDDIAIRETCPSPTKLTATHITQTSTTLSWATGGASNWELEYDLRGFTLGNGIRVHTATNPHTLTGLTPGTTYDFYVRDSCGSNDLSTWAGPYNFNTISCPAPSSLQATRITLYTATLSWITGGASNWVLEYGLRGFTPGSGAFVYNVSNPYTLTALTSGTTYDFYVRDSCGSGNLSTWAGPYNFNTISCPTSSSLLAFRITQNTAMLSWITVRASNWVLEYGLRGFTLGNGIRVRTATNPHTLTGLKPGTTYDFYVRDSCGSNDLSTWAGPHNFNTVSCPEPSSLLATNITQNTATLSWTTGGASNWELEYDLRGFTLGNGIRVRTATNPHTLTGLTPGTDYDFYVRDSCGSGNLNTWAGPYNFNTIGCPTPSSLLAINITQNTATLSWAMGGASNWVLEYDLRGFTPGSGAFVYNVSNPYTLTGLTSGTTYDFYVRDSCGSGNLSTWAGPYNFNTIGCPTPSSFLAINITQNTATLSWAMGGASNWNIEWGTTGFTLGSGTFVYNVSNPYILTRLKPGTDYDFYVRDSCGRGNVSTWVGPQNFRTLSCPSPSSLLATHITQTSAELSWISGGASNWDLEYGLSGFTLGSGTRISTTTPSYTVSGLISGQSYQFYVRDNCGTNNLSTWVGPQNFRTLSCPFPLSLLATHITQTSAELSWISGGASNWDLEYGLSGFTLGSGTRISTTTPSYTVSGLTSGQSYQFYVRDSCGRGNVSIWVGPQNFRTLSCPSPSSLLATHITQTSAELSWISGGASNWDLEYGLSGFTLGSGTRISTTTPSYTVSGLTSGQSYQFYVRDSCGGGNVSTWSGLRNFRTLSCPSPSSLLATHITQTSAELSWISGGASNWNIEWGTTGFTLGSGTFVYNVSNPYILTRLKPGTDYDFYVRDSCGGGNVSTWVGPQNFKTLSCPSPSSLLATHITQTSAELSWISGRASNWDLEYGLSGFTLGSGTRISTTTPSYTVSGLTSGQSYQFYVRDSCGGGNVSTWAGPQNFRTLSCPSPSSLLATHITQTSAELSWISGGASNWDLEYGLSGFTLGSGTRISTTTPSYTVSGLTSGQSYQFYVRDSCGGGNVSTWVGPQNFRTLSCPSPSSLLATHITQTSAELSWISGGASNWDLEYGLSGFTLGSGTRISTTTPSYTVSGLTSGQSYQFYVRDSCGGGNVSTWAGPQNFRTLSCPSPSSLLATHITQTSAELSWVSGGASNWVLEYGLRGFTPRSGTFVYNVSNPYTLTGLTSGTTYDFYVRDSCGNNNLSIWAGPYNFNTISCPTPSSLRASHITQNTATLSWISGGASNWVLEYGLRGLKWNSGSYCYQSSYPDWLDIRNNL